MGNKQQISWKKIGEVIGVDSDLYEKEKTNRIVIDGVRVCLFDLDNKICMIKSEKYGFYQLPGGGVEPDETLEETLRRETIEETGWQIVNAKPIGYVVEHYDKMQNNKRLPMSYMSYVFRAQVKKFVGTNYEEDEIAEGFAPVWTTVSEAITALKKFENETENYAYRMARRDQLVLKFLLENQMM